MSLSEKINNGWSTSQENIPTDDAREAVKELRERMYRQHLSEKTNGKNMGLFHCDACKDLAMDIIQEIFGEKLTR